jgi:hypothetical protein
LKGWLKQKRLAQKMPIRLAVAMMLKNEHQRLPVTLKTLEGLITNLIIFDTGSEDDTIQICEKWCQQNNVKFDCKQGTFVDFSTSRNVLLDLAESIPDYDFLLQLDCNDEVQGGKVLLEECEKYMDRPEKVFMMRQKWKQGRHVNKYLNARLTKRLHGWRYKAVVHEYLAPPPGENLGDRPRISEEVILYQDRDDDDDKTSKRFQRDEKMLSKEVEEKGDSRDIFYLAQTKSCLGKHDEAYNLYQRRGDIMEGFHEERFHSYLRSAEICFAHKKNIELGISNALKAAMVDYRVEPLLMLAKIFRHLQEWDIAYFFSRATQKMPYPINNILFISDHDYVYERYLQHSIICYYVPRKKEGLIALDLAEKTGNDLELHKSNRALYDKLDKPDLMFEEEEDCDEELVKVYTEKIQEAHKAVTEEKNVDKFLASLLNAFRIRRVIDPLLMLADYARLAQSVPFSYVVTDIACLFNESKSIASKYIRWNFMGIFAFYVGEYQQGKEACAKALKMGYDVKLDRENFMQYVKREKELKNEKKGKEEKKEEKKVENGETYSSFVARRTQEILPSVKGNERLAKKKAELEWKLKK